MSLQKINYGRINFYSDTYHSISPVGVSVAMTVVLLSWFFATSLSAQELTRVSGQVTDEESGEPLSFASVFLNNSTFGAIADEEGNFEFLAKPGNYDLIVNFLSYQPIIYPITITDKQGKRYVFKLKPLEYDLKEISVESKRDAVWYKNYEIFKESFLGSSENASKCEILNPEVLIIDYNLRSGIMKVKARDVLKIENKGLGYNIEYLLDHYEYDIKGGRLYYQGFPRYVETSGSKAKMRRWEKARTRAYLGSPDHFFSSVMAGTAEEEGYTMIEIIRKKNPNRPTEAEIRNAREKIRRTRESGFTLSADSEEMNVIRRARQPAFITTTNNQPYPGKDLLTIDNNDNYLDFPNVIEITYSNEKPEVSYSGTLKRENHQVSRITLTNGPTPLLEVGALADPLGVLFEGYMGWEKLADILPINYRLPSRR